MIKRNGIKHARNFKKMPEEVFGLSVTIMQTFKSTQGDNHL